MHACSISANYIIITFKKIYLMENYIYIFWFKEAIQEY
jgi:hypothetical protein